MEFRILGPLEVVDEDRVVAMTGSKLRPLLAVLIVRHGESTSADRLADDLWGDAAPPGFQNALQSLVSKLRRALGAAAELLRTDANGYRFDVAPTDIDAVRFELAAARGKQAIADGDAATAAAVLSDALALWRGNTLEGLANEGVLRREALRLDELRLDALEDRIDADLRLGRHAALVSELTALAAQHPLRERLHGFAMLAMYRSGRQADALRHFQDARNVLGEEVGLDPGPELRALEAAILAHDPALDIAAPAEPVGGGAASQRSQMKLTSWLSSFIGREDDIETLSGLIECNMLVSVVGPGGAGKTRLAAEVARRRGGRVFMVELASLTDGAAVPEAIAAALDLATTARGARVRQHATRSIVDALVDLLANHDTLLLLDNCEHLITDVAHVAELLVVSLSRLRVLTTSREPLGVPGEVVWPVPPMTLDETVALFADRAATASGFAMSPDTAADVRDVCDRLDGLPLAIELAAGRVRAIPVHQLATRLDDRFRLLTGGSRTAMPRQQTLRAVVEWSYDLLFDDEQRVFDRLSVFAGGCSLEAAEAVCAGDDVPRGDVGDLLAHLVDKSLVIADHSSGDVRFKLLQTLSLYGQERLVATGTEESTRLRHAEYFANLCARGRAAFRGEGQVMWLDEVRRETDNIKAVLVWALERGDTQMALSMVSGAGWRWWFSGRADEGWRFLDAALRSPGDSDPRTRARATMWAGLIGSTGGVDQAGAVEYANEAVRMLRELDLELGHGDMGVRLDLADALLFLGGVMSIQGDMEASLRAHEDALPLYRESDTVADRAFSFYTAGQLEGLRGNVEPGERIQSEAVDHLEAAGMMWAVAVGNGDVSMLEERRGAFAAALARTTRAREAARSLRFLGYEALMTARMAMHSISLDDTDSAEQLAADALTYAEDLGFKPVQALALHAHSVLARRAGRLDDASDCAARARAILHREGPAYFEPVAIVQLGLVAELRGELAEADRLHRDALELSERLQDPRAVALSLEGLAGVAAAAGDGPRAARLLGAADALRRAGAGCPGHASDIDRIMGATAALVDEVALRDFMAQGADTATEQLLDS